MGRVKIVLKRLEKNSGRQATYSKRKNGLLKKADELSILCDVDIVLVAFSPGGKPTLFRGRDCCIDEIVEKFVKLTPQERAKRHLESVEVLKKSYKKMDHEVDISQLLGPSYQPIEGMKGRVNLLRARLLEVQKRLSYWSNMDKVDSIQDLEEMENFLIKSLDHIRTRKENLPKQQHMDLQCADQFQNEMNLLFSLGLDQQLQPFSCIQNDHGPHMVLPKDLSLFPQRDKGYSVCTSFESYTALLGAGEKVDIPSESTRTEPLNSQLYEQQAYPPYNFSVLCDNKFEPRGQMNVQESTSDYCINGRFGLNQLQYGPIRRHWASTSGCSAAAMFGEQFLPQGDMRTLTHLSPHWDINATPFASFSRLLEADATPHLQQYYPTEDHAAEDHDMYLQATHDP